MSFFCTIPEQPVVVVGTEYLKKTLGLVGKWFSTDGHLSRTRVTMPKTGESSSSPYLC